MILTVQVDMQHKNKLGKAILVSFLGAYSDKVSGHCEKQSIGTELEYDVDVS